MPKIPRKATNDSCNEVHSGETFKPPRKKRRKSDKVVPFLNFESPSSLPSRDYSESEEPPNKNSKKPLKRKKGTHKDKLSATEKKIKVKNITDINSGDEVVEELPKTKAKSKLPPKKKKRGKPAPVISTSEEESDAEDQALPLSDDLPNYVDKFGIFETKINLSKFATTQNNIQNLVIDEICLEGLDGITLEALWTRVSIASESQLLPFPDGVVRFLWHVIQSRKDIEFFMLEKPREELVIFDRYENNEPDLGACMEPAEAPLDIYPYAPVKNADIYGSAASYATRTDVTKEIRKLTLEEVEYKYGLKLIMVGTQKVRTKVLTNPKVDPNIELSHQEYLLLERIARSRRVGELTQGKVSLQVMDKDSKALFYTRKILLENELLSKQQFFLKSADAHNSSCTLLHLNRFYNVRKTKSQIMTEQIVEVLRKRPNYRMDCADVRRVFGHRKSLKKLFKFQEFQKVVKVDMCHRYRDLYPNASSKEWKQKGTDCEKLVRTIELINPSINVGGSWNEDDAKDDSSDDDELREMIFNRSLLYQIYMFIHNSGQDGISLRDIRNTTGLDYYSIRSAIKLLLNGNYINGLKVDMGRQRVTRYHCNYQVESVAETAEVTDTETLGFVSNVLGIEDSSVLLKPKEIHNPTTTANGLGRYATIRQLCKQNTPENSKALENIFKNQHGYETANNDIKFSAHYGKLNIFGNEKHAADNPTKTVQSNFKQVRRQIKKLNKEKLQAFDCNISCPLNLPDLSRNYHQLCYIMLKLVQPILVGSKYEIKTLVARFRYECKLPLSKEKLQEFKNETVQNTQALENCNNEKGTLDFNYLPHKKPIKYQIYMGPKPEMIYHAVDENNVEVTVMISTNPSEFGETSSNYVKDNNATLRTIKRTKFVIDTIRQEKVVTDIYSIARLLTNLDTEEGYKVKIDKKSIDRIYMRLVKAGLIKVLCVSLQLVTTTRNTTVLCDAAYDLQYSVIESLIEQLKMKAFSCTAASIQVIRQKDQDQFNTKEITSSVGELNLLANNQPTYVFKRNSGRDYGNAPKFMRMRILHEFMFYLIYDYPTDFRPVVTEGNSDLAAIYSKEKSWKMFVPPLPKHKGWPQGWILICDLLLRMPLSLFVKACNVSFVIPELNEFLEDPVKQHTLIKFLPPDIRNALLYRRKYIFTIHETITRLCFIGLVQIGPQKLRDKDQVFVYLNRNASLWDTTTSAPGYHYIEQKEYKHLKYYFDDSESVVNYWYQMWNICMHTKLGLRLTVTGMYITIEQLDRKPSMIEAQKPQTPETVALNDNGTVPGDKRGAAGFDSALWSHVKRNWIWSNKSKPKRTHKKTKKKLHQLTKVKEARVRQGKKFLRKVLPRKNQKVHKASYDAIDKKLMVRLQQSRPEWVESEDKLLHICKIVTMFIYRTAPRQFIPYTVIRDVIHRLSPLTTNKTSGSVRRRLFNIFGPTDKQELFQKIAKALDFISFVKKYFHTILQNEKNANGVFVFLAVYFFQHQNEIQHIFDLLLNRKQSYELPVSTDILEIVCADKIDKPKKMALYSSVSKNYPETEKEITIATIQSMIHSSLACYQHENGWMIQLFSVYRKYPQEFLRNALHDLRAKHLTSGRHAILRKHKHIEGLPIITKLFQFSHYYCYTQITKYPPELFVQAHEIYLSIWKNNNAHFASVEGFLQGHTVGLAELSIYADTYFKIDIPKEVLVLNPNIADHTELIRELAERYKKMLNLIKSGAYFNDSDQAGNERNRFGYRWPMIHRFLRSWFLSDEDETIVNEDDDITCTSRPTTITKKLPTISNKDGKKIIGDLNPIRAGKNNDTTFEDYEKKLENFLSTNDSVESSEDLILLNTPTVNDPNLLQNYLSSLQPEPYPPPVLEETNESVQEVPENEDERIQYLMDDALTVEQIMEEMLSDCPEEDRKIPKATNLARLLVIGLFPELDEDEERLERLYRHFLVICPDTKFFVPVDFENNEMMKYLHTDHPQLCKKLLKKVERDGVITKIKPELDIVLEKLKYLGASEYDIYMTEKLVTYVQKKEAIGVPVKQLKGRYSKTQNVALSEVLNLLTKMNILLRVGIINFVYVHYDHCKPWLVESCVLADEDRIQLMDTDLEKLQSHLALLTSLKSYKEVKILVRPWILVDGSLNVEIFKKWLYILLGHCLSDCIIPLPNVFQLCPFLKPVDVYYLLECLKYLGCVKLIIYKTQNISLITTPVFFETVDADITDDFEDVYVECDALAFTKLGTLLNDKGKCYDFTKEETSKYDSF